MKEGISKHWTPEQEKDYKRMLSACRTFAQRHLIMTVMDTVKYDGRTREGKRAIAQARLRLATATDEELQELAELEQTTLGHTLCDFVSERVKELKDERDKIRATGIKKENL